MIELIPAIDLIDGKCVRLSQGEYDSKKVYNEDPLEVAKQLEDYGISRLHVVDLDGAASQHVVNYAVLERIAAHTSLVIDFGGGVKTDEDLKIAFNSGAHMVTGGSIAVKQPEVFTRWLRVYGSDRIILGADVKGEKIAVNGQPCAMTVDCDNEKYIYPVRLFEESAVKQLINHLNEISGNKHFPSESEFRQTPVVDFSKSKTRERIVRYVMILFFILLIIILYRT